MTNIDFSGLGVALITPFKEDESVDFEALSKLIEFQVQHGVDYLVVLGTTAETPTLTEDEKAEITRVAVTQVRGRIPVVLGVSSNCTRTLIHHLHTTDFNGIDAVMSVVPYYNKPSQEGIYQHFKAVVESVSLPVIVYNVPGRTGMNMTAETTLRLAHDFSQVVAIKEASGNIAQVNAIINHKPSGFQVISGDDSLVLPLMSLGAVGVISVIGNAIPEEFSRMIHLALKGDYENARIENARRTELLDLLFVDGSPAGVKSLLNIMGFCENKLRLPLVPVRRDTYEKIREIAAR
ncbi:MAG: 4-hydroxy-tetrahydrodipicolinate synthase [Tannerella sp.]|jgi:4-hydroxy-tetrahydrodipicolinate synthase|nr:4-hydroxy-tetrahydrodipicolinate synthase [Tannerella sp.]